MTDETRKRDSSRFLIITIATHDGRANIKALEAMFFVGVELQQMGLKDRFYINVSQGHGIAAVRTVALRTLRTLFEPDKDGDIWTMWLDSDVQINEEPRRIAEYIATAERTGMSFAGAVRMVMASDSNEGMFKTNAFRADGKQGTYSEEELHAAKPFELKLKSSGLALAYIKTPMNYAFHNEGGVDGKDIQNEDVNFYKENPQIDLRFCGINNEHHKTVALEWNRKGVLEPIVPKSEV